jgi:hypothetical protein
MYTCSSNFILSENKNNSLMCGNHKDDGARKNVSGSEVLMAWGRGTG